MKLPKISWKIRPDRLAYYGLIGAIALVVGSFAMWRLISYFSPQTDNSGIGATVILRVSDYSEVGCPNGATRRPLPNSISDTTVPCLADNNVAATTLLNGTQDDFNLFRLEGQAEYK